MSKPVSIYLSDGTLRKLDVAVERQAAGDRARGYTGRQVANRSKLVEQALGAYLDDAAGLSVEQIRSCVVPLAQEYGAQKVSLFGSFARNDATGESDVDLLLDKGNIKGLRVLDFQEAVAQRLGRPVDVVTTAGASERFLSRIKKDEVVLYAAS